MRIFFLLIILQFFNESGKAQNIPSFRWEPGLSFSKQLAPQWSTNAQLRVRQAFNTYTSKEYNPFLDRIDVRAFATYEFFNQRFLSLGYLLRNNDPLEGSNAPAEQLFENRFIQQFSIISEYGRFRLGNRLAIEERIYTADYETRMRYRAITDFPLSGETLNIGGYYLLGSNELLLTYGKQIRHLENRFTIGGGKLLNNGRKIQLTLQSRFRDLLSSNNDHIIQLNSIYFFSF